ncbi:P-loop containing nucleoside triphosphate hydrolase [Pseudocohnilembus persalinus]|uniref:p-loop containing nucleoside triphosphate hydrolase n=1 Tax=Pseudocohnilembus persalinus TaxID=266149 RepID=A0A0V0R947_PSEPJ|nr:P-loop containing nucleoside triphosphate hydrolase [Pseudocohnilembus persalinus]|eukprot:KRX10995.1 P-loop containing nucleoside triphosphate hydrolase [Pseudocohnilembus persalinus]
MENNQGFSEDAFRFSQFPDRDPSLPASQQKQQGMPKKSINNIKVSSKGVILNKQQFMDSEEEEEQENDPINQFVSIQNRKTQQKMNQSVKSNTNNNNINLNNNSIINKNYNYNDVNDQYQNNFGLQNGNIIKSQLEVSQNYMAPSESRVLNKDQYQMNQSNQSKNKIDKDFLTNDQNLKESITVDKNTLQQDQNLTQNEQKIKQQSDFQFSQYNIKINQDLKSQNNQENQGKESFGDFQNLNQNQKQSQNFGSRQTSTRQSRISQPLKDSQIGLQLQRDINERVSVFRESVNVMKANLGLTKNKIEKHQIKVGLRQSMAQSMQKLSKQPYPIQLISYEGNLFKVNQKAIDILAQCQGKMSFVSIIGKYRTGKSYLMNQILNAPQGKGFKVDSSVKSQTKGIWLWSQPIYSQNDDMYIYFLDSEGTGSIEQDKTDRDIRISSLAILLSSYVIYNSVGNINEESINELSYMTKISTLIEKQNDSEELQTDWPKFLWLLRDFTLDIVDNEGKFINSTLYLEQPVENEQELKNLERMKLEQCRPQFQQELKLLRDKILENIQPKRLKGFPLTPQMLCSLIQNYVTVLNSKGVIPNAQSSWEFIIEQECQLAYERALEEFQTQIQHYFSADQPLDNDQICQQLGEIKQNSYMKFEQIAGYKEKNEFFEKYRAQLMEYINQKEKEILQLNFNQAQMQKCFKYSFYTIYNKIIFINHKSQLKISYNYEQFDKAVEKVKKNSNRNIYDLSTVDQFNQDIAEAIKNYKVKCLNIASLDPVHEFMCKQFPVIVENMQKSSQLLLKENLNKMEIKNKIFEQTQESFRTEIEMLEEARELDEQRIAQLQDEAKDYQKDIKEKYNKIQQQEEQINELS